MTVARRGADIGGRWLRENRRVVSALLVEVEGSAPLPSGAEMLIDERGEIEGSITGGCVESAVAQEAQATLEGAPPRLLTYGISDELAGTVGLSCGGTVHVFIQELAGADREVEAAALDAAKDGEPAAVATLLDGERRGAKLALIDGAVVGSLRGPALLDHSVGRDAAALLAQGAGTIRGYGAEGETLGAELRVHIRSFAPPPRMVIFGAIDFSAALAKIGKELGYVVAVCDPREPFLRSARFESVAETIVGWPQAALAHKQLGPRDAVLVFSHDPKLDVPAIVAALETDAGYIGALGSRKTTADRERRLREAGVGRKQLDRLHAPCGLDIGSGTPEEVAISVLAEIVAARAGRDGAPLRDTAGAIHARDAAASPGAGDAPQHEDHP